MPCIFLCYWRLVKNQKSWEILYYQQNSAPALNWVICFKYMYTFQLAHLKLKNLLRFTFNGCHSQDANSADCKQIKPVVYNTLESTFLSYIRGRHHSCLTHHSSVWALDSEVLWNKKSLLWMLFKAQLLNFMQGVKKFWGLKTVAPKFSHALE